MNDIVNNWIKKALEDLKVAEHELSLEENQMVTSAICFHSQQAVEKLLKAYLTSKNVKVGKSHDIAYLLQLCIHQDSDFLKLKELNVEQLTFYAVEIRYPDDFYIPSIEEAKASYELAVLVKEFILKKIEV
ncbi:HEPN domain-containing protein [Caldicellulosiruptor naganoensis]|uniref:HEPN domain-containing protein n=1 Tax=Caldicellulosiruptor naganoensis TaxID=29324 RepID=A0ABY7BGF4_9FIRM|nr:HEPN domain-containing protein [Caldicellulosiruptor naganoensis]WAM31913.1 HEPN domain-containing protein [Caldicellulosiruptor naganoensis]